MGKSPPCAPHPAAISASFLVNEGRSSGLRLVTRLPSTTTSFDRERVGPVEVVERLHLAGLWCEQPRGAPGLPNCLPGLGQLDLLDAFSGDQEHDRLAPQGLLAHA